MKKFNVLVLVTVLTVCSIQANAQDWIHGKKGIYSVGIGGTDGIAVGGGTLYRFSSLTSLGFSMNASGEYKVHKYVGLGWQTGLNIYPYFGVVAIEIPLGIKANIHIMEFTSASIKDKLDVYAGLDFGGGPAFFTSGGGGVYGVIHVGPQVGVRYWVAQKIAVFGQFGWGHTFANAGITF